VTPRSPHPGPAAATGAGAGPRSFGVRVALVCRLRPALRASVLRCPPLLVGGGILCTRCVPSRTYYA